MVMTKNEQKERTLASVPSHQHNGMDSLHSPRFVLLSVCLPATQHIFLRLQEPFYQEE